MKCHHRPRFASRKSPLTEPITELDPERTFAWLEARGFIRKTGRFRDGAPVYVTTAKGARFLAGEFELDGPHAAIVGEVMDFLRHKMAPRSAAQLIDILRRHDWRQVDADTRFILLHEIDIASARLRERAGLPPIDDALPHERATAFPLIRELLE